MTAPGAQTSIWHHLAELRGVALRILALVTALSLVTFFFMPWIFDTVILAPARPDFPTYRALGFIRGDGSLLPDMGDSAFSVQLINIELASQFFIHVSSSFWLAIVLAFPVIIYLLWGFIAPGLYPQERRGAGKAFVWGNVMFYLGMATGYFVAFPMMLRFLADYRLSDAIANTVSLTSYMDSFYILVFMMGLLFELPLLAWMLGRMGLLRREFFSRYRRYAIVILLVISGIITPTSDLVTLMVVFLPVYLLWELSALIVPRAGAAAPASPSDSDTTHSPTP